MSNTAAENIYEFSQKRRSLADRRKSAIKDAENYAITKTQNRLFYVFKFKDGSGLKFTKNCDRHSFYIINQSEG